MQTKQEDKMYHSINILVYVDIVRPSTIMCSQI